MKCATTFLLPSFKHFWGGRGRCSLKTTGQCGRGKRKRLIERLGIELPSWGGAAEKNWKRHFGSLDIFAEVSELMWRLSTFFLKNNFLCLIKKVLLFFFFQIIFYFLSQHFLSTGKLVFSWTFTKERANHALVWSSKVLHNQRNICRQKWVLLFHHKIFVLLNIFRFFMFLLKLFYFQLGLDLK